MRLPRALNVRFLAWPLLTLAAIGVAWAAQPPDRKPREPRLPPEFRFASDSLFPVMKDASHARWAVERLLPILAKYPHHAPFRQLEFWALALSGASADALIGLTDSLVGGVYVDRIDPPGSPQQAQHCLDLAEVLTARRERLQTADTYAQRALRLWPTTETYEQVARIRWVEGAPDSAIALLRFTIRGVDEVYAERQCTLRDTLAKYLEATGRSDEAIATLFESVTMDTGDTLKAVGPLHLLWRRHIGATSDLKSRIRRARDIWRQWYGDAMGFSVAERWHAPVWSLRTLDGGTIGSSDLAGQAYVLSFCGTWSVANRGMADLAEHWHRRSASLGVRVVVCDFELPGPGAISRRITRAFMQENGYHFPVGIDQEQRVFSAFEARAYPQVYFVDPNGLVRGNVMGFSPARIDSLEARATALGKLGW